MPLACPTNIDVKQLRAEISSLYRTVLEQPDGEYHFHRGPTYAVEFLGYEPRELEHLPEEVTRAFAGIGNPLKMGRINTGETVVDIGSGAGTDLFLAARQTGPEGKAIGIDMTPSMLDSAGDAAEKANLRQVDLRLGDATALPVDTASVDVIISNGVLNLVPEKDAALDEMRRILKTGGRIQIADIVLDMELSEDARADIDLWTG